MSRRRLWISRVMMGIIVLFMLFDGISKLMKQADAVRSTLELGYTEDHLVVIGILGIILAILYAIPRTSVLGVVLLTAYYGGVVATHVRMDNPLFSHILFPVYLAILAWGALWLIDENVRRMMPFNRK